MSSVRSQWGNEWQQFNWRKNNTRHCHFLSLVKSLEISVVNSWHPLSLIGFCFLFLFFKCVVVSNVTLYRFAQSVILSHSLLIFEHEFFCHQNCSFPSHQLTLRLIDVVVKKIINELRVSVSLMLWRSEAYKPHQNFSSLVLCTGEVVHLP